MFKPLSRLKIGLQNIKWPIFYFEASTYLNDPYQIIIYLFNLAILFKFHRGGLSEFLLCIPDSCISGISEYNLMT